MGKVNSLGNSVVHREDGTGLPDTWDTGVPETLGVCRGGRLEGKGAAVRASGVCHRRGKVLW